MFKRIIYILSILLLSSNVYAATVSFDQLSTSADLTVAKFNADLDRIYIKVNSAIQTDNIASDTITEDDFADAANPRIRDYEIFGEFVDSGLLQTTTSGTLTGTIPSGTAYPRGYRINKASGTSKTYTASMWTYTDLDLNGDFQYSEVAIGGATPAVATNSIRLFRASTDATEVVSVQDLRVLNPVGAFRNISDIAGEATLEDIFNTGDKLRGGYSVGWINGCQVSWDTHTGFKVRRGTVWINGHLRSISTDISVPQTADDPAAGTSGLDTGSIAAATSYDVYAVADQSGQKTFSITFSTNATTPTGATNYRHIGRIRTDAGTNFTSADIFRDHSLNSRETIAAWAMFAGAGTVAIRDHYRAAALIDAGLGLWKVAWDFNFTNTNYLVQGTGEADAGSDASISVTGSQKLVGSTGLTALVGGGAGDVSVDVLVIGDVSR